MENAEKNNEFGDVRKTITIAQSEKELADFCQEHNAEQNYKLVEYVSSNSELAYTSRTIAVAQSEKELTDFCKEHFKQTPYIKEIGPLPRPEPYFVIYPSDIIVIGRYY